MYTKKEKTIKRERYKWMIAGLCFLMVFTGLGFCCSAKSIYIAPMTKALRFARSTFSVNDSFRYISTAIASLFFDRLISKYGTKRVICLGMGCFILSSLIYAYASRLLIIYLGGFFLGLGVAWTTTTMVGVVINKWFSDKKGTVLGIILASNGFGAAIAIQFLTPVIYQDIFGYREAYVLTSLILVIIVVLIMIFYKDVSDKSNNCLSKEKNAEIPNNTNKNLWFYTVVICIFSHMLSSVGMIVTPHFTDIGIDPDFVAYALSFQVVMLAVFKIITGYTYDKFGFKASINICLVSSVFYKILLIFITNSTAGRTLVIVYSVLNAVATPMETVMLPIIALELFGQNSFNRSIGILTAVAAFGQALGMPLISIPYDICGNYCISFVFSLIVSIIIFVVMNISINAIKKENINRGDQDA